jgi:hypothetical protein
VLQYKSSSDPGTGGLGAGVAVCPVSLARSYRIVSFSQEDVWIPGDFLYNTEPRSFSSYSHFHLAHPNTANRVHFRLKWVSLTL